MNGRGLSSWTACLSAAILAIGAGPVSQLTAAELDLSPLKIPGLIQTSIGVTRKGTPIRAAITADDLDLHIKKVRVLLIGGLDGSPHTSKATISVVHRFYSDDEFKVLREHIAVSAIVCGNPDGLAANLRNDNGSGGNPARGYPPTGDSYTSPTNPEAQYIWRWIGMHAPDEVVVMEEGKEGLLPNLARNNAPDSLVGALEKHTPCQVGKISGTPWPVVPGEDRPFKSIVADLTTEFKRSPKFDNETDSSEARRELQRRVARTPIEVASQLSQVYGHALPTVAYIPAVACMGRIRLGELTNDPAPLADIEKIVAPYRDGDKPTLTEKGGGSEFSGHLIWGALYDATKNPRYVQLALNAANQGFDENGAMREAMPFHLEMSDSVFMGCPILALAGRLTNDNKYFEMCVRQMRFMNKLNIRQDGLHRHSPLDETAWGRGNGFPALGLTLTLSEMPENHPLRAEVLDALRKHLDALLPHQDPTGTWHQVIDHPESYRELTATCMITFAMVRGVQRGWLDGKKFEVPIQKGWEAIKTRVATDGALVDVCTGTGKMKSLREYYDRPAILGKDDRGGAMALLIATEMAKFGK